MSLELSAALVGLAIAAILGAFAVGIRTGRQLRRYELTRVQATIRSVVAELAQRHGARPWRRIYPTSADALADLDAYITAELGDLELGDALDPRRG